MYSRTELNKMKKGDLVKIVLDLQSKEPEVQREIIQVETPTPIFKVVDDSGVTALSANGGRYQAVILKYNSMYFKIEILSESYAHQSYIKLFSSINLDAWTLIKKGSPKNDFDVNIAYGVLEDVQNAFGDIIEEYKKVIINLFD